jgi:hypothetical protein
MPSRSLGGVCRKCRSPVEAAPYSAPRLSAHQQSRPRVEVMVVHGLCLRA